MLRRKLTTPPDLSEMTNARSENFAAYLTQHFSGYTCLLLAMICSCYAFKGWWAPDPVGYRIYRSLGGRHLAWTWHTQCRTATLAQGLQHRETFQLDVKHSGLASIFFLFVFLFFWQSLSAVRPPRVIRRSASNRVRRPDLSVIAGRHLSAGAAP